MVTKISETIERYDGKLEQGRVITLHSAKARTLNIESDEDGCVSFRYSFRYTPLRAMDKNRTLPGSRFYLEVK